MNLAHLLARSGRTFPDRPAVFLGERQLYDYRTLALRAASIAGHLRNELNLVPGDRVVLFLRNCPEYLELLYASWWAGLVTVPVNAKLHPKELVWIVENAQAQLVFAGAADVESTMAAIGPAAAPRLIAPESADYTAMLAAVPLALEHRTPDDLAWLFYTSGTTGRPKGVMLTHRNLLAMALAYFADVDAVSAEDTAVYAAPMSHGAGLYNFMFVMQAARHVVPESGGFAPAELLALANRHGNACLFAAPTMVKRLVDHVADTGADCSGFKTIVYGGGPMYAEDIRRALDVMGNRFVQIYGQGESPMTITALSRAQLADRTHPRWPHRIASVGAAQCVAEVRVADPGGADVPANEVGEVLVRGETVMAGYWRNAEATASTIRGGWLWTGDMGSLDEDGFLTLKDRSRDVIISGGSNIYPREVEEALLTHPGVREAAVVGRPDAEWGEVVVAFVVAPGVDEATLDAVCLQQIARFKRPKLYRFVQSLPKNNYGKVLKATLREWLESPMP
ncbi:MAG: class I adenylate-forming enzyme family protein [Gaiella sp.]